jgi:thymidylate synthase (FAD)
LKIIDPSYEILQISDGDFILKHIEKAARTCYKSEDKITDGSAYGLLKGLLKSGHHSVFEHAVISVRIICDRGITHEIVRHRLSSFSQESTRYANYSKEKFGNEITVIRPFFWQENSHQYRLWQTAMEDAEKAYLNLIGMGASAQEARSVLPNSLKTEIIVTANLRQWRHILDLRCSKASHPQIRQIMLPMLKDFADRIPVVFEDLAEKHKGDISAFPEITRN